MHKGTSHFVHMYLDMLLLFCPCLVCQHTTQCLAAVFDFSVAETIDGKCLSLNLEVIAVAIAEGFFVPLYIKNETNIFYYDPK